MKDNIKILNDMIKQLKMRDSYLRSLNGQNINTENELEQSYLHKTTSENGKIIQTEEESAKFERDNKEIFKALLAIEKKSNSYIK